MSYAVDVYMQSSAYLVRFSGSCVIAACHEFIMFHIDTWLYIDLLRTRKKNVVIVIIVRLRVLSFRKLNLTRTSASAFVSKLKFQNTH